MTIISALMLLLLMCSCEAVDKNKSNIKEFAHDLIDDEIDDLTKD